ncbi:acyl-[acyl-carrier-protein] thioesterase [Geopsychrobacter electrodiphilus]|uniref:acyl-[acyl-carrier-protein] thioesterase n=1 Tax=Geopsychrobacter electrodiphilus TaxID=225196 RepID=UPI0003639710|nr:acyl-ACP thioesterase domain-containing protein [Geopsychrobacter electrodiphilus]
MSDGKFQKSYSIRYFELDQKAELRFGVLLDFLQDIAGEDAVRRGFGVEQLLPRGLTWMLSRYRITLNAVAGLGDCIQIRTWPSIHKGLSACREFEIFCNDVQIGAASSAWMLIDLETRRPVRPRDRLGEVELIHEQVFAEPLMAIKFARQPEIGVNFRVRRADLDLNCHVNNRVFFDWAVEALTAEAIENQRLQQVDINYLAEALAGDVIVSYTVEDPIFNGALWSHLIRRVADGKDLAKLQSLWVPR